MIKLIQILINIAKKLKLDVSKLNDGYHSFAELYDHRNLLFISFCNSNKKMCWKYKHNYDGSRYEGWFGLGYNHVDGSQITYHLPEKYYDLVECDEYVVNPFYDGHTSSDVLKRLIRRLAPNMKPDSN